MAARRIPTAGRRKTQLALSNGELVSSILADSAWLGLKRHDGLSQVAAPLIRATWCRRKRTDLELRLGCPFKADRLYSSRNQPMRWLVGN